MQAPAIFIRHPSTHSFLGTGGSRQSDAAKTAGFCREVEPQLNNAESQSQRTV